MQGNHKEREVKNQTFQLPVRDAILALIQVFFTVPHLEEQEPETVKSVRLVPRISFFFAFGTIDSDTSLNFPSLTPRLYDLRVS